MGLWPFEAPFTNVAVASEAGRPGVTLASLSWLQGTRAHAASYLHPGRAMTWAVWGGLLEIPGIERRTARDELIGQFTAHHLRAGLGVSRHIGQGLGVGISCEWLYQKIDVFEAGAVSLNVGFTARRLPGALAIGAFVRQMPLAKSFGDGPIDLRTAVGMGLGRCWSLFGQKDGLYVAADALYWGGGKKGALSFQVRPQPPLAVRGAYLVGVDLQRLSLGVGVDTPRFSLDYAYLPLRFDFGDAHCFGFSVFF
ncbi:MAG: hypothetical protein ONB23_09185 [candidate division KSB1 bacterium]|nr:hypothetical protein [candidate division KSB1 bacterium]